MAGDHQAPNGNLLRSCWRSAVPPRSGKGEERAAYLHPSRPGKLRQMRNFDVRVQWIRIPLLPHRRHDAARCSRSMQAGPLEKFVEDAAIRLLESLTVSPKRTRTAAVETAEREIEEDERQLAELHDMWISKEIDSAEYRKDRRDDPGTYTGKPEKDHRQIQVTRSDSRPYRAGAKENGRSSRTGGRTASCGSFSPLSSSGQGTKDQLLSTIDFGRIEIEENELA